MFKITPFGDHALRIEFGTTISERTNQRIRQFALLLEKESIPGVVEWVPTYTALTLFYDPYVICYHDLIETVESFKEQLTNLELPASRVVHIPTCYGGKYGPDLTDVAQYHDIDEETVISIHAGTTYLIYMMGFTPGFPYLGGMSPRIATPRLDNPRVSIPAGSVGIGGEQTGIYSMDTPGGWRIIGKTPLKLYDPDRSPPSLLKMGDYVKFVPIDESEYLKIERAVSNNIYEPRIEQVDILRGGRGCIKLT